MEYIATFGANQDNEGFYVRIFSKNMKNVFEYMNRIHNGNYCMVYSVSSWEDWEKEAKEKNLNIEEELYKIDLDTEELFVLLDTTRNMYWNFNNYGYTDNISLARKFTFAAAEEKVNAPAVNDLEIIKI